MATAVIDGTAIHDWDSFHNECARVLGFPTFYGRNLNAFADCLQYLDEDVGMTRYVLEEGETLEVRVSSSGHLRKSAPDILDALKDTVEHVNRNYHVRGLPSLVNLVED